ncbi:MAG: hypothetical protein CK431_05025 [Mycobacterium sp.]|nr:MAG: hypothetical protein CK431_05025 [Mycobacterium sp.]
MHEHDEVASSELGESLRQDLLKGEQASQPARKGVVALLSAIACIVFGSRLIVISAFGSPVPLLDQWDGEAAALYAPYLNGTLSFASLFGSHNGHRILLTRLLALGHLEFAGEWNTRLEMIFGAAVLTAFVTWLAALLLPLVARDRRLLLSCFIALGFAFPIDFENTVWGFQSQVYLSFFFGIAALAAFASAPPFSLRWFGGLNAGVLAYFSFASGVAAIPAAVALVSLQLLTNARKRCGREVAALVVMTAVSLAIVGWGAKGSKAMATVWTFAAGLGIFAALTIVGGIPVVLFWRRILMRRPNVSDRSWVMLGISVWVAIQLVLFAYGRGSLIAPRYMDAVLLVYPLALVAVLDFSHQRDTAARRARLGLSPAAWVFAVAATIVLAGCMSVLGCSYWNKAAEHQLADVRAYLDTGNVERLKERGTTTHGVVLNHPFPERQASFLRDPAIRAVLPPEIRPSDGDNAGARGRMLLKGTLASATGTAVRLLLLSGPAFLALGIGVLFAAGTARSLRDGRL